MQEFESQLTEREKVILMKEVFPQNVKPEYVRDVGSYLSKNFSKIDGFDARWSSLITSSPLLFEDVDYYRVRECVNNTITEAEIEAYKRGDLQELYATFESMLMNNIQYYERIMSFCTIIFKKYIRISDDEITSKHLDAIPDFLEMTPTQIWCGALINEKSTLFELNYAYNYSGKPNLYDKILTKEDGTKLCPLESNYERLQRNPLFTKFIEYRAFICGTNGFRVTLNSDLTSNKRLSFICSKFTKTTLALSDEHLSTVYDYINEIEEVNQNLFKALDKCMNNMFCGDKAQYAIYVYYDEFFIYSSKFTLKVSKTPDGQIHKSYMSNKSECFQADLYLSSAVKEQIAWAEYKIPNHYNYDKNILKTLLTNMLMANYKEIICIKRMNEFGIISKIKFSGIFDNVKITEECIYNNDKIRSTSITLSKKNAANYIIERGYYIFGLEADVYKFDGLSRKNIINHFSNYCIPVINTLKSVLEKYRNEKNDIINIVVTGYIHPGRLCNHEIKKTFIKKGANPKTLMKKLFDKQYNPVKKNYWGTIK